MCPSSRPTAVSSIFHTITGIFSTGPCPLASPPPPGRSPNPGGRGGPAETTTGEATLLPGRCPDPLLFSNPGLAGPANTVPVSPTSWVLAQHPEEPRSAHYLYPSPGYHRRLRERPGVPVSRVPAQLQVLVLSGARPPVGSPTSSVVPAREDDLVPLHRPVGMLSFLAVTMGSAPVSTLPSQQRSHHSKSPSHGKSENPSSGGCPRPCRRVASFRTCTVSPSRRMPACQDGVPISSRTSPRACGRQRIGRMTSTFIWPSCSSNLLFGEIIFSSGQTV